MKPKYSRKELLAMKDVLLAAQEIEPLAYVTLLINDKPEKRGIMFYTGDKEIDNTIQKKIRNDKYYIFSRFIDGTLIPYSPDGLLKNSKIISKHLRRIANANISALSYLHPFFTMSRQ